MTDKERLVENFIKLVKIDSESFDEANVAAELRNQLEKLGGKIQMDNAAEKIGGNCGNMVAKFDRSNCRSCGWTKTAIKHVRCC